MFVIILKLYGQGVTSAVSICNCATFKLHTSLGTDPTKSLLSAKKNSNYLEAMKRVKYINQDSRRYILT